MVNVNYKSSYSQKGVFPQASGFVVYFVPLYSFSSDRPLFLPNGGFNTQLNGVDLGAMDRAGHAFVQKNMAGHMSQSNLLATGKML